MIGDEPLGGLQEVNQQIYTSYPKKANGTSFMNSV
jgi:hypothetical protein